jgi:acyl-CoA synthetase (AMP-forming)/AMP-acid ligase II/thioesterase domain-containing protein/acyl carrier protein
MFVGFHNRVVWHAMRRPEATAVLSREGERLSYRGLLERMRRFQRGLVRLGVRPTDRVASLMPDGPRTAEVALGVSATCVYAPLNPAAPAHERIRGIAELRPRWVLAPDTNHDYGVPVVTPEVLCANADDAEFRPPEEDRVAILLSTSGTTSKSKQVQCTLSMYGYGIQALEDCYSLTERDCHFTVVPQFHSLGLVSGTFAPLATGGSVVLCGGFDRDRFEQDWDRAKPTWFSAVPSILRALADLAPHLEGSLSSPRFVRSAAAPLPSTAIETVERMFGARILQTYGMTEAICVTMETPEHHKRGSVGRVTAGELRIVTESGEQAKENEPGLVLLRGPNVTIGYDEEAANQEAFEDGWLVTGDEGRLDEEGYLFLQGRFKEFINRGGQKVNPSEVDGVLQLHTAVSRVATFAMPDERLGEEVAAVVVTTPGARVTEAELQEFAAERLANYKVPRRIVFAAEIPLSATGKYQRRKLAEHFASQLARPAASREAGAGETPIQNQLLSIFRDVTKCDDVTVSTNFFDYCDSLQAARLLLAVERELGIPPIPPPVLWRAPNVIALAEYIGGRSRHPKVPDFYVIEPQGELPAVVFISPDLNYGNLWRELKGKAPMFGLRVPARLWTDNGSSLEAMGAWCAEQLEQAALPGRFCLAGWCLAGVLAFETARQLHARGIGPAPVVIFDGHDVLPVRGTPLARRLGVWSRHLDRFLFHMGNLIRGRGPDRLAYFRKRVAGIAGRWSRWQEERTGVSPAEPVEAAFQALQRYQARPYAGSVVHLMAEVRPRGRFRSPARVWGPFVQDRHEWHEVPGDHHSMFEAAGARRAAEILARSLENGCK